MPSTPDDLAGDAAGEQQYTETNDPTVTRFDAGAGGVAESRDETEFAIDREAAQTPTDTPDSSPGIGDGPHRGSAEGEPESADQRRTAADERTDPAAPPEVEESG